MIASKVALAITTGMRCSRFHNSTTFTFIDTKCLGAIRRTSPVDRTVFTGFKLTVLAGKALTILIGLGTITGIFRSTVSGGTRTVHALRAVHAGVGTTRTNVESKLAGQAHKAHGAHAVFKVVIVGLRFQRTVFGIQIELGQDGQILGSLAANSLVFTLQVARCVFDFVTDTEFADRPGKAFGAIAAFVAV